MKLFQKRFPPSITDDVGNLAVVRESVIESRQRVESGGESLILGIRV